MGHLRKGNHTLLPVNGLQPYMSVVSVQMNCWCLRECVYVLWLRVRTGGFDTRPPLFHLLTRLIDRKSYSPTDDMIEVFLQVLLLPYKHCRRTAKQS